MFERVGASAAGADLGEGASAAAAAPAADAGEAPPDEAEPGYWPYAEGEDPEDFVPAE